MSIDAESLKYCVVHGTHGFELRLGAILQFCQNYLTISLTQSTAPPSTVSADSYLDGLL